MLFKKHVFLGQRESSGMSSIQSKEQKSAVQKDSKKKKDKNVYHPRSRVVVR